MAGWSCGSPAPIWSIRSLSTRSRPSAGGDAGASVQTPSMPPRLPRVRAAHGRQGRRRCPGRGAGPARRRLDCGDPRCRRALGSWRRLRRCGAHRACGIDGTARAAAAGWLVSRDGAERHDLDRRLSAVRALETERTGRAPAPGAVSWTSSPPPSSSGRRAKASLPSRGPRPPPISSITATGWPSRWRRTTLASQRSRPGPAASGVDRAGAVARRRRRPRRRRWCRRRRTATSRCPRPGVAEAALAVRARPIGGGRPGGGRSSGDDLGPVVDPPRGADPVRHRS